MLIPSPNTAEASYTRLAGSDRYQTAVKYAQKGWGKSEYVFLVKGDEYAEALCAGPLASKYNAPILFTEKYSVSSDTLEEIKRLEANKVIIVGGYDSISGSIDQALYSAGVITIERVYGSDKYETSVEIAKRLGSKEVALASADQYAGALSVASVAAAKGIAILLQNYKIERTYIIGGTEAISKEIEKQVPTPEKDKAGMQIRFPE